MMTYQIVCIVVAALFGAGIVFILWRRVEIDVKLATEASQEEDQDKAFAIERKHLKEGK